MSLKLRASLKNAIVISSLATSGFFLHGCSDEKSPAVEEAKNVVAPAVPAVVSVVSSRYDQGKVKVKTFANPGLGQPDEYLDIFSPTTAFGLYSSLRDWEETPESIAESLKYSVPPATNQAEVFRLGSEYGDTKDEFLKRDLMNKIAVETKLEAEKFKGKQLVKFYNPERSGVILDIGEYDFELKGFKVDTCLFSDKLDYRKEEKRIAQTFQGINKERCYFRTTNAKPVVGFTGGSKTLLKVEDENLARQIAANRTSYKLKVYGYIQAVEKSEPFSEDRTILIAPQRIDILDTDENIVLSTVI